MESLAPEREKALVEAVHAALAAQDFHKAADLAEAALRDGLENPLFLNLRAYRLEQQDKLSEALVDLRRAHEMAPGDPPVLNALGLILGKLERWREAVAIFNKLIAVQPDFPPAHYNKGWNAEFYGDLETATKSYREALRLKPDYPEPMTRSAGLAARRSALDEADALAGQALALDSAQFYALQTLIRTAIARKDYDRADALIAKHLADGRARPLDQALTYGYLGDLRNTQKRYAEAFAAYTEGNNRQRAIFAPKFERADTMSARDYAVWLTQYIEAAPPQFLPGDPKNVPPSPAAGHVFLVGSPRSGTTLLENILISHPDIVSLEEKPTLQQAATEYLTDKWGLAKLAHPRALDQDRQRDIYWQNVRAAGVNPDHKVFIDKHPLYLVNLLAVAKLFPRAKVLFALRDPRDVVLSCFRYTFQMNRSMFEYLTLEGAARFYDTLMRLALLSRDRLGLDWYELRHERLIEDFDAEVRRACDFIGVPWDDAIRDFAEHAKSRFIATPSAVQVTRGINREGMGQWRNYREQLEPVMPILRPWIERFGYDPD